MFPLASRHFLAFIRSPVTILAASALIIIASAKTAYALVVGCAIIWVYSLSVLLFTSCKKLLPKEYGAGFWRSSLKIKHTDASRRNQTRNLSQKHLYHERHSQERKPVQKGFIALFLTAFIGSVFLLFLFLLNPFLAWSLSLALLLVPVLAVDTGVCMRFINLSPRDAVLRAFAEGLFWSALILAFALIREPIGNLSLSLPGGSRGIMEFVFNKTLQEDAVRLVSVSAGALILVGYFIVIVRKLLPRGGSHGV